MQCLWQYDHFRQVVAPLEASENYAKALQQMEFALEIHVRNRQPCSTKPRKRRKKARRSVETALAELASLSDGCAPLEVQYALPRSEVWRILAHIGQLCNKEAVHRAKAGQHQAALCLLQRSSEVTSVGEAKFKSPGHGHKLWGTLAVKTCLNRASIYNSIGATDKAIAVIEPALARHKHPELMLAMCVSLSVLSEHQKAVQYARMALKVAAVDEVGRS